MLMAYDDSGLKIKNVPTDDAGVSLFPIGTLSQAVRILEWAREQQVPDVLWGIVGEGPYGVHAKTL